MLKFKEKQNTGANECFKKNNIVIYLLCVLLFGLSLTQLVTIDGGQKEIKSIIII